MEVKCTQTICTTAETKPTSVAVIPYMQTICEEQQHPVNRLAKDKLGCNVRVIYHIVWQGVSRTDR